MTLDLSKDCFINQNPSIVFLHEEAQCCDQVAEVGVDAHVVVQCFTEMEHIVVVEGLCEVIQRHNLVGELVELQMALAV